MVGVYISFAPFEMDSAGQPVGGAAAPGTTATVDRGGTASSTTLAPKTTPNVTRLEFQNVLVTNVQTISAPVSPETTDGASVVQVTGSQYVVTLALSPEQSERFVFATEFGRVWLSIDPASVADDGTRLVTLGTVFAAVK